MQTVRTLSDAPFCGIWSGFALFANYPFVGVSWLKWVNSCIQARIYLLKWLLVYLEPSLVHTKKYKSIKRQSQVQQTFFIFIHLFIYLFIFFFKENKSDGCYFPETDNCPSRIGRRGRMTIENISWSVSTKECCWTWYGSNPRPPDHQSDVHPNEPPKPEVEDDVW